MLRTSYLSLCTLAMVESYEPRRLQSFFQVLGYYLAYYNSNLLSVKETLNIIQDFQTSWNEPITLFVQKSCNFKRYRIFDNALYCLCIRRV